MTTPKQASPTEERKRSKVPDRIYMQSFSEEEKANAAAKL